MLHREIEIDNDQYLIKASLKIPKNKGTKKGIIMAHGAIINRQSLIRTTYSLAEYLCNSLDAYVIVPDFQGETIHQNPVHLEDFSQIFNITTKHLAETYDLDTLMGFGHSMGCYVISEALQDNPYLDILVNYAGPISELIGGRRRGFIDYLVNYLASFDYGINTRNLLKYLFDHETTRYLEDVMLKQAEYKAHDYDYNIQPGMFTHLSKTITHYLSNIKTWGKPTLLLFGTEDKITQKTISRYQDNP